MASFTRGTSFVDGVAGDVTAAKLHALMDAATPVGGLVTDRTAKTSVIETDVLLIADSADSNNLKKVTVANMANNLATAVVTTGTIKTGTFGTTTSTAATITTGTITTGVIPTLTAGTTTSTAATFTNATATGANITNGTIQALTSSTANITTGTIGNLSTTLAGDFTISQGTATLGASGVSASSYGTTSEIPRITVDAKGRITSATTVTNPVGFRNRIINGDMRIDQRNAGASVTLTTNNQHTLDRWSSAISTGSKLSVQRSTVVPTGEGFSNSMLITSLSAYSITSSDFFYSAQKLEGFNVGDLMWGTANAKTITLSFWVRSSLTGTFVVAARSGADDYAYPATYTINSANTWEKKTITISGPTSGTFATENTSCFGIWFSLGAGSTFNGTANTWASGSGSLSVSGATNLVATNGATLYITGVQLEAGSTATEFERRPYGTELALCQRYYFRNTADQANSVFGSGLAVSGTSAIIYSSLPVPMRAVPTISGSTLRLYSGTTAFTVTNFDASFCSKNTGSLGVTVASGMTAGQAYYFQANNNTSAYVDYSSEL